jgi:hypothetical protein
MVRDFRDRDTAYEPLTSLGSLGLTSMRSLTVLRISDMKQLKSLSGLSALSASISTLSISKCTALTTTGCTFLGSMHSLVELSVTGCGNATPPSLRGLTRLVTLHIDLHDNEDYASYTDEPIDEDETTYDSSCYTKIPAIPPSLRRLRFHIENSSAALERPQRGYMASLVA